MLQLKLQRPGWRTVLRCTTFWLCVLVAAYWAADRAPPLLVVSTHAPPVARGSTALIEASVKRELRGCSVSYSRSLTDAAGYRFELGSGAMNAQSIAALERDHPGKLLLGARVPERAAAGPAHFAVSLEYVCNPLQYLWPIPVRLLVPLDIH
jgi:hypothetical protein